MTCLFVAAANSEVVGCINFDYGQQHGLAEREAIRTLQDLPEFQSTDFKFVDLSVLSNVTVSALNRTAGEDTNKAHPLNPKLPASFVPGRNLIMLTIAAVYAQSLGATELWTGVCQTDYSGYPDCRDETIQTLAHAVRLGLEYDIDIMTPLMFIDKADTFKLAEQEGVLPFILENSHTCYVGNHEDRHEWGYGCGECPACKVRAAGYNQYKERYNVG